MLVPERIKVNKARNTISLNYINDEAYDLSAEYLRVFSPSAEVRGHSSDQQVLQIGKSDVLITDLSKSGNYALRIHFDDGHDSGIYTWDYLYDLAINRRQNWAKYIDKLEREGQSRDPGVQIVKICGP